MAIQGTEIRFSPIFKIRVRKAQKTQRSRGSDGDPDSRKTRRNKSGEEYGRSHGHWAVPVKAHGHSVSWGQGGSSSWSAFTAGMVDCGVGQTTVNLRNLPITLQGGDFSQSSVVGPGEGMKRAAPACLLVMENCFLWLVVLLSALLSAPWCQNTLVSGRPTVSG